MLDFNRVKLTDFLAGGGEMGALMRAHDWSATAIGPPDTWPQSLRTAVRILLNTNHPMFIWWGPELIQFYNDAYRQTMGPERHPSALGQRGRDCWAEIWHIIGPQVEQVMSGGGATWHENQLVPVTRYGRLEQVYWTYGYSPIDDDGGVGGVLVVCRDVTKDYLASTALREREAELARVQQIGRIGGLEVDLRTGFHNRRSPEYLLIHGLPPDGMNETHEDWVQRIHPDDREATEKKFREAVAGNVRDYTVQYRIVRPSDGEVRWISVRSTIERDESGGAIRLVGAHSDVTEQVVADLALRQSEERFRKLADQLAELNATLAQRVEEKTRERDRIWNVSQDLLVVADRNGIWRTVNPAWTRTLGWSEAELLDRTSDWLEHPGDAAVIGMFKPVRGAIEQFGLAPAQGPGPGRVDRSPDPVAIGDHQQILRHVPDPVALPGLFLDALRQRRIQFGELVGKLAKSLLALPKREVRHHLLGDVAVRANQANGPATLVALDRGPDRNPAHLAIAGSDDSVLHGVIANIARDGLAEFFLGSFAIIGMDALNPVLVGFVLAIRGQPVNQQIFRRPAIVETGPQVDFETADPPDLLHPREFGLALPQCHRSKIVLGHVTAHDKDTANAAIVVDRTIAIGPVDLLQPAVTRDRNELVLMPGRASAAHHLLDLGTDDLPDFSPALPSALSKRARVALGSHRPAIGIVIELNELTTPPDEHRVVGIEQDPQCGPQTLRPGVRRTQGGCRPVMRTHQRAHLPATGEEIRRDRFGDLQHQG